ncbi:MAG: hypothetical protein R6U04_07260 [Bacteroidales bacterium]
MPAIPRIEGADNEGLATLIKTHNPQLVTSGGTEHFTRGIDKSLLLNPGFLANNKVAWINLKERKSKKFH